ncbi:MAG: L,D-transpeptidase family protein [Microcystaceae cyanobacterium]
MQTLLLSKVSVACCTSLLALFPLTNMVQASAPPLTKVPQATSPAKTSTVVTPAEIKVPVKVEATPVTTPAVTMPVTPQVATPAVTTTPSSQVATPAVTTTPPSQVATPAVTTTPSTNKVSTSAPKPAATKTETKPTTTAATSENKVLASRLVLDLSDRKVYVYKDNSVIATYPVAVGKKGWETPTGNFQVIQMTENPIWENPWNGKKVPASINGPIGVRWIGFWTDGKNTIGFHGTPVKHEKFLGQAVSHGCVRMKNPDVVSLFGIVKSGTPVVVQK